MPPGKPPVEQARARSLPERRRFRRHVPGLGTALGLGTLLMLLVSAAIADRGGLLPLSVLGVSAAAIGLLYLAFPRGPQFALGVSTGLAMYACTFIVLSRAAFPGVPDWALPVAHALPILTFVAVCLARRASLRRFAQQGERSADLTELPHSARWLLVTTVVGAVSLSAPINRLTPDGQALALLGAMAVIAAVSARAVGDVIRLLVDMAVIFQAVTRRLGHLIVPMAAYSSLWALLVVVFGCLYRIADHLSQDPLFHGPAGPIRLDFADALHFSVVTLATVGYGDINPNDVGIRVLASIQMLLAQLLLLFGFVEIMRGVQGGTEGIASRHHAEAPAEAPRGTDAAAAARPAPPGHRPAGAGE